MSKTKQKSLILDVVNKSYDHLNAYQIYDECKKIIPNISLGTVYRNLNLLVNNGNIKRIKIDGEMDKFDHFSKGTEHYHFHCIRCGKLYDLYGKVIVSSVPSKYEVLDYELVIRGICDECQKEE